MDRRRRRSCRTTPRRRHGCRTTPQCKKPLLTSYYEALTVFVLCTAFVADWIMLLGLPPAVALVLLMAFPTYWHFLLPSILLCEWEYTPLLAWALSYVVRLCC